MEVPARTPRLVFDPGVNGGGGRHHVPVLRTGNDKRREDPREPELPDGLGMLQKQDKMPQQSDRLCEHPGPSSRTQEVCWKLGLPMRVGTGPCM